MHAGQQERDTAVQEGEGRQARVTTGLLMLGFPFLIWGRYCGLTFKSTFFLMCVADAGHWDTPQEWTLLVMKTGSGLHGLLQWLSCYPEKLDMSVHMGKEGWLGGGLSLRCWL